MCGITALLSNDPREAFQARSATERALGQMIARGPDAQGIWQDNGVTLGHNRLAIQDLHPRSNQPMVSSCRRYVIVFNGEIYNHAELRSELVAAGQVLNTTSDTEVLLALFAQEGLGMLPKLRGMFAFAIWDTKARELFMARDPYGIKPLYYALTGKGFIAASQVKALLASGSVSHDPEPAGLAGFYLLGSVPEPWTLYHGIFALPAGHYMCVREGNADKPVCWHDIRMDWQVESNRRSDEKDLQELVRSAVTDSVRAHLISDVPVSVFLSAGIDSSVVAGIASELGAGVECITIGFQEFIGHRNDEVPEAALIAAHYGLAHSVRMVDRAEFEQDLPHILNAMDQPSVDGINTWFASKAAAELGYKVALSGVGGDELFCGYSSFHRIPPMANMGRAISRMPAMNAMLARPFAALARYRSKPKIAALPEYMCSVEGLYFLSRGLFLPQELPYLMAEDIARCGLERLGGKIPGITDTVWSGNSLAAVGALESTQYLRNQLLRDSDWASMAHSLELRTPLVDVELLQRLGRYTSKLVASGKSMLAGSVQNRLPESVVKRSKTGFSLPMESWLPESTGQSHNPALQKRYWARRWALSIIDELKLCV